MATTTQNSEETLINVLYEALYLCVTSIMPTLTRHIAHYYTREPYHTSALSGHAWVLELLEGNPRRIRSELGMHKEVFQQLLVELQEIGYTDSRYITLEEQLAIFLYTCVTGLTIRHVGERFQRANGTISYYFRKMAIAFGSGPFYAKYVKIPDPQADRDFLIPKDNTKLWPFFQHCIGAIDGSHINFSASAADREAFRNRKGFISQNCLFVCSFNLQFTYSLTGWEGSASDARVFNHAMEHAPNKLTIPGGYYLLADGGYPHTPQTLVPYLGKRYHLAEWGRAQVRPQDREELFNLRHAQARNVIERIFGVLKHRFRILLLGPSYQPEIQAIIPAALAAIHNFIRISDPDEGVLPSIDVRSPVNNQGLSAGDFYIRDLIAEPETSSARAQKQAIKTRRDQIAEDMWQSYQHHLQQQGDHHIDGYLYDIDSNTDGLGDEEVSNMFDETYSDDMP